MREKKEVEQYSQLSLAFNAVPMPFSSFGLTLTNIDLVGVNGEIYSLSEQDIRLDLASGSGPIGIFRVPSGQYSSIRFRFDPKSVTAIWYDENGPAPSSPTNWNQVELFEVDGDAFSEINLKEFSLDFQKPMAVDTGANFLTLDFNRLPVTPASFKDKDYSALIFTPSLSATSESVHQFTGSILRFSTTEALLQNNGNEVNVAVDSWFLDGHYADTTDGLDLVGREALVLMDQGEVKVNVLSGGYYSGVIKPFNHQVAFMGHAIASNRPGNFVKNVMLNAVDEDLMLAPGQLVEIYTGDKEAFTEITSIVLKPTSVIGYVYIDQGETQLLAESINGKDARAFYQGPLSIELQEGMEASNGDLVELNGFFKPERAFLVDHLSILKKADSSVPEDQTFDVNIVASNDVGLGLQLTPSESWHTVTFVTEGGQASNLTLTSSAEGTNVSLPIELEKIIVNKYTFFEVFDYSASQIKSFSSLAHFVEWVVNQPESFIFKVDMTVYQYNGWNVCNALSITLLPKINEDNEDTLEEEVVSIQAPDLPANEQGDNTASSSKKPVLLGVGIASGVLLVGSGLVVSKFRKKPQYSKPGSNDTSADFTSQGADYDPIDPSKLDPAVERPKIKPAQSFYIEPSFFMADLNEKLTQRTFKSNGKNSLSEDKNNSPSEDKFSQQPQDWDKLVSVSKRLGTHEGGVFLDSDTDAKWFIKPSNDIKGTSNNCFLRQNIHHKLLILLSQALGKMYF